MFIHLRNMATGHYLAADRAMGPVFDSSALAGPFELFQLCDQNGGPLGSTTPLDGQLVTLMTTFGGAMTFWRYNTTDFVVRSADPSPPTAAAFKFRLRLATLPSVPGAAIGAGASVALETNGKFLGLSGGTGSTLRVKNVVVGPTETFELWTVPTASASVRHDVIVPLLRTPGRRGRAQGVVTLNVPSPPGGTRVLMAPVMPALPAATGIESVDDSIMISGGASTAAFTLQAATGQPTGPDGFTDGVQCINYAMSEWLGTTADALAAAAINPVQLVRDPSQCFVSYTVTSFYPRTPAPGGGDEFPANITLGFSWNPDRSGDLTPVFVLAAEPANVAVDPMVVRENGAMVTLTLPDPLPPRIALATKFFVRLGADPYHCRPRGPRRGAERGLALLDEMWETLEEVRGRLFDAIHEIGVPIRFRQRQNGYTTVTLFALNPTRDGYDEVQV